MNITNNLIQMWKKVGDKDGWEISQAANTVLLKSPAMIPNLNLAIVDGDLDKSEIITTYFSDRSFGIMQPKGKSNLLVSNAQVQIEVTEMHLSTILFKPTEIDKNVSVLTDLAELPEWCAVASEIFGFDTNETYKFYKSTYNLLCSQLLYYRDKDGKIIGVGQIHVDDSDLVYIATIGVLEQYRRNGIGQKIMNACMLNGKNLGGKMFALHASESGEFLYKKLGFQVVEKWDYYII